MKLHGVSHCIGVKSPIIGRISLGGVAAESRSETLVYCPPESRIEDFSGYLAVLFDRESLIPSDLRTPAVVLPNALSYVDAGDVISIDPSGFTRVLFRKKSRHNFILITDQCNSLCLMCSQPPKSIDDSDRIAEHLRVIKLIDSDCNTLGFTGGEPTIFGSGFVDLVRACKEHLPKTHVHVLTNGRAFVDRRYALDVASVGHTSLSMAIPLYAAIDTVHDYVVQAKGAFDETLKGFYHLNEVGIEIELRVVLHKITIPELTRLARFITRYLPFVSHVALMGLETTGLFHQNAASLWIDPVDYQSELVESVEILDRSDLPVSIYNLPLCVLDGRLWPYARASISDWKNEFVAECQNCIVRENCSGFFQSGLKRISRAICSVVADDGRIGRFNETPR